MATALLGEKTRRHVWTGTIIDVDVHAVVPSVEALFPYLAPVWQHHIRERGWTGPPTGYPYPPGLPSTARPEWRPVDGRVPASNVSQLREHILDPWDVDVAIVNCYYPVDYGHPDLSAALASAVNDWLSEEWLNEDKRLRASIALPVRDPAAMVREIDRVGGKPGFVQVLMPVRSGRNYGNRFYHPVYEAITRHNLVTGIHWGGSNDFAAPTPSGWPSWYIEEYVGERQYYQAQVTSLVAEGVFQAFPTLRVSMLEIGFTWLPTLAWRMDKEWKGLRREIPWVSRAPSSLIRDHMRFSVAPLDAGSSKELARVVKWLESEDLLMFATDYPHTHDDDLSILLEAAPESMRARLMSESARDWYCL